MVEQNSRGGRIRRPHGVSRSGSGQAVRQRDEVRMVAVGSGGAVLPVRRKDSLGGVVRGACPLPGCEHGSGGGRAISGNRPVHLRLEPTEPRLPTAWGGRRRPAGPRRASAPGAAGNASLLNLQGLVASPCRPRPREGRFVWRLARPVNAFGEFPKAASGR